RRDGAPAAGDAAAALLPEDLDAAAAAGAAESGTDGPRLPATVEVVEYHGRELAVQGRLSDGQRVHFRTRTRLAPDDAVELTAPPERVLVFPREEAGAPDPQPRRPAAGETPDPKASEAVAP
ncbi:TOBE domain-containing protein, partial [Streptomyces synnematoformans]|uniref:TOBE domain-containing protein n=1 Tax=Streptomyces synnematoformans TaxID=415721 RepID=UPI0031DF5C26